MKPARFVKFRQQRHPRRNLPASLSRKRGESNFVTAFSRAYIGSIAHGIGGKEFSLSGFGIADFIWITWRHAINPLEGTAISIEKLKSLLNKHKLTAFEMKLADWRKGLSQAYRYRYFADVAILVLPPDLTMGAKEEIERFRALNVGLWSFDPTTERIRKLFTPRRSTPFNLNAKDKALVSLGRRLQFSQFRK